MNRQRRIVAASLNLITCASVCLMLIIASGTNLSAETGQSKLKVGMSTPLTGPLADYGNAIKNGLELARKENPAGFKNVEFVFEDNRYDSKLSLSTFNKLSTIDDVDLIYLWGATPSEAVVPVADKNRIPTLAVTNTRSIAKDRDYIIRFCYYSERASKALLARIRSLGYKNLGILKFDTAYIEDLLEGLKNNLNADEKLTVIASYQLEDMDFKSAIARLKGKNFDAVGVFLGRGQINQFYRQSKALGYTVDTFGSGFFENMKEIKEAAGGMEGAFYANPYLKSEFRDKYLKQYGNDLQVTWAANAYDLGNLLVKLFSNIKQTPSSDEIISAFKSIKSETGASGKFGYIEDDLNGSGFDFQMMVKQIRGGKIEALATAD